MNNNYIDTDLFNDINEFDDPMDRMIIYITYTRLDLYNRGGKCGSKAIREALVNMDIGKIPSIATIGRILKNQYLTNGRTGYSP